MSVKVAEKQLRRLELEFEEVDHNLNEFQPILAQTQEEWNMTKEDIEGKLLQIALHVAMREELDLMYEQGLQSAGHEFALFRQARGDKDSKEFAE